MQYKNYEIKQVIPAWETWDIDDEENLISIHDRYEGDLDESYYDIYNSNNEFEFELSQNIKNNSGHHNHIDDAKQAIDESENK